MADLIKAAITFVLSNFSLTFLVVGLLFSLVAMARAQKPVTAAVVVEKLLSWHVFWAIGVCYFYNFVMHAFFGKMSAAFIGWADSPFQFEVRPRTWVSPSSASSRHFAASISASQPSSARLYSPSAPRWAISIRW